MSKGKACTPSLIEPVVMVMGTEIADRPLRVRSGNSARAREGFYLFSFLGAYISSLIVFLI